MGTLLRNPKTIYRGMIPYYRRTLKPANGLVSVVIYFRDRKRRKVGSLTVDSVATAALFKSGKSYTIDDS